MACTLDLCAEYLISPMQTSAAGLSRLLGRAVRRAGSAARTWTPRRYGRRLSRQFAGPGSSGLPLNLPCFVDDSILRKARTDPSALICTRWDYSQGRFVEDLNFVSLLYQASKLALPITVEFTKKTEVVVVAKTHKARAKSKYTKNEWLLGHAARGPAAGRLPLPADRQLVRFGRAYNVLDLGHHFGVALECSHTVTSSEAERTQGRFQALSTLTFSDEQFLRIFLRLVQPAVLVSRQVSTNKDGSQSVLYLIRNDTSLNQRQLTTIHQRWWKAKEYYKSLK